MWGMCITSFYLCGFRGRRFLTCCALRCKLIPHICNKITLWWKGPVGHFSSRWWSGPIFSGPGTQEPGQSRGSRINIENAWSLQYWSTFTCVSGRSVRLLTSHSSPLIIASGSGRAGLFALTRKCQLVSYGNALWFLYTHRDVCGISILFLRNQLCFVVLDEEMFVKLKVAVMQVPKAIKEGSTCTAALSVINCVSGLQVCSSIWGLVWVFFCLIQFLH